MLVMMLRALCCLAAAACAAPVPPASPHARTVRLVVDGNEVGYRDPTVLSVDDANERFHVNLTVSRVFADNRVLVPVLHYRELRLPSSSWGSSGDETWFVFR